MAERIGAEIDSGTLVYDPKAGKVGEYRGKAGPHAMLRPVGGGREWEADPDLIRPATAEERLSAAVKVANTRSLTGRCGTEDMSRPPDPFTDCATCMKLAVSRAVARAQSDGTAETDANVLLRRHQRRDHEETEAAPADPRF
jgi:hypothetical protein